MSKRFSKFILFGLVFTLFILSLAILFASCNDDDDKPVEKVFSSDGIVFTLNELWGYYEVTGYNGNADYVLIPSMYQSRKVTKIADKAFLGCTKIVEIRIEDGVEEIGSNAFEKCSGLTNITIPNSVTNIGNYAFASCSKLTNVTIPNSYMSIGNYAFCCCTGFTSIEIPYRVESIGEGAFSRCTNLSSVTIGDGVEEIGRGAFGDCTNLATVTVGDWLSKIGSGAFDDTLWYSNQPNGVVYVGKVAYKYKGAMPYGTSIVIKEGTKSIAEMAFANCSNLVSITIPNSIYRICSRAFYKCSGLTNFEFPKELRHIGYAAFENCTNLTEINWTPTYCVGDEDNKGGYYSHTHIFENCTNLSKVYISKDTKNIPLYINSLGNEPNVIGQRAKVIFDGTKSEWNNHRISAYIIDYSTIVCTDGIIEWSYNTKNN